MNNVSDNIYRGVKSENIFELNPLWVKMATKFVKETELRIVNNPPIPPEKKDEVKPNGFII